MYSSAQSFTELVPVSSTEDLDYKSREIKDMYEAEVKVMGNEKLYNVTPPYIFPPLGRCYQSASASISSNSHAAGECAPSRRRFTHKKNLLKLKSTLCPGHSRAIVDLQYTDDTEIGSLLLSSSLDSKSMFRYDTGD